MEILKSVFNHFSILEFFPNCTSSEIVSALSSRSVSSNLANLVIVLDRIRLGIGVPMYINSGYRSDEHNRKVGGVLNSQHLTCSAADVAKSKELVDYFNQLLKNDASERLSLLGIYQLIDYDTFYHIGIKDDSHKYKLSVYIDKRNNQLKLEF